MARRVLVLALVVAALAALSSSTTGVSSSPLNDTGLTATAVTVTFDQEVRITSYDQSVFTTQDPSGRATMFRFSGGDLENGMRFSMSWSPSDAEITDVQWETTTGPAGTASTNTSAGSLTYDQIMAQIAHYPGPDEPLYQPKPDEQIWLTDLEGHADIYDNDSIKINYAPGFDKSQITRIDVYRNGIKMRFLPALFDVLTNAEMKTFDGNPDEHSPASSHTDHAIDGYQYSLRFYTATSSVVKEVLIATIMAPVRLASAATANIGNEFQNRMDIPDSDIVTALRQLKAEGFRGVQFGIDYFLRTVNSTTFFPQYTYDPAVSQDWQLTPPDDQVRRMVRCAKEAGLQVEIRIELGVAGGGDRGELQPSSTSDWFANYTTLCLYFAQLASDERADTLCVGVELNSMELYEQEWATLVRAVKSVFSGSVTFAEQTCALVLKWPNMAGARWDAKERSRFWDAFDIIEMNAWLLSLDTETDQHASAMVARFVSLWQPVINYYRSAYPGKRLTFGEIGTYAHDGAALGTSPPSDSAPLDFQEVSDTWYAYLTGCAALGIDGEAVWCVAVNTTDTSLHPYVTLDRMPAIRLVESIINGE